MVGSAIPLCSARQVLHAMPQHIPSLTGVNTICCVVELGNGAHTGTDRNRSNVLLQLPSFYVPMCHMRYGQLCSLISFPSLSWWPGISYCDLFFQLVNLFLLVLFVLPWYLTYLLRKWKPNDLMSPGKVLWAYHRRGSQPWRHSWGTGQLVWTTVQRDGSEHGDITVGNNQWSLGLSYTTAKRGAGTGTGGTKWGLEV